MIPSLDVGYIVLSALQMVLNIPLDLSGLPGRFVFLIESLATIGMVASVVLLVLIVYTRIRIIQVEHHGFLVREERERLKREGKELAAKNPRWEMIMSMASSPNESDWRRAILEADIMLDTLLVERGYVGETLGERLKNANPLQFTTLDIAWEAHRVRNAIAHLGEAFPITERDVRATMDQYRRVFEEFGYI